MVQLSAPTVRLYRYFVSQSSEFCRHNPLCCFSMLLFISLSTQSGNFWIDPRILKETVERMSYLRDNYNGHGSK